MFSIEMLPANYGDALWIRYGSNDAPNVVLIDCGFKNTYREIVDRLPADGPQLELLVLTHVDADHIQGAIPLLQDARVDPARVGDVWFNGWDQLAPDELGALQGEFFAMVLEERGFNWNTRWEGKTIVVPDDAPPPRRKLCGGLELTLLSPTWERVEAMKKFWRDELEEHDIDPGDAEAAMELLAERPGLQPDVLGMPDVETLADKEFHEDTKAPNGSSIALLAEFDGKRVLLNGDAFPSVVASSIKRLLAASGEGRLELDAFKVSHHGSSHNTSPELLDLVNCREFLISSNGKRFHHPAPDTIARIVCRCDGASLRFNYRTPENEIWDDSDSQDEHGYTALYPETGGREIVL
jgi:beta-lactamase superfamily II metal-dependent hydrolase